MTTPRIEEMVSRKVAITKYLRNTYGLDDDDTLNAGEVEELCEMIVEHFAPQAHQAGIDEAVEVMKKNVSDTIDAIAFKTMNEKRYSEGMENGLLHHKERCMCKTCIEATRHAEMSTIEEIAEALDDTIKALQDNK